jgi:hypothetical protein
MRVRHAIFLPVFLCLTFLFRMCFLSFGPVNAPVASYKRNISFKRKLLNADGSRRRDLKEQSIPFEVNSVLILQTLKSKKAVQNKKLKFSLLFLLAGTITFFSEHTCSIKINLNNFITGHFLSSKGHAILSVLRI